jgi:hypothetical protein
MFEEFDIVDKYCLEETKELDYPNT